MKKYVYKMFVCFVAAFLLVGCSCKKNNDKVSLQVGDATVTSYITITGEQINSKISNKDSFLLFVYQEGCYGCRAFKPIVENVVKEKNLQIYAVDFWNGLKSDHELRNLVEYTPTIILYEEGELDILIDPNKNSEYFADKDGFVSFLNKYTNMPTLYYISKEQLDEKIANDESFIVYYSRKSCSDCSYLNQHYLKEYLKKNYNTKYFYVIETDSEGIRFTDGVYNEDQWVNFKNSYGLSNVNNPLGHGVGYVPTLQYYEDGEIKEMMVYFNDGEYIENADGSYSIIINNSYYDDNPYNGQTIPYNEYKGKLESFYNQKLKDFLDKNLVKVD